jgi:hypothetical protein
LVALVQETNEIRIAFASRAALLIYQGKQIAEELDQALEVERPILDSYRPQSHVLSTALGIVFFYRERVRPPLEVDGACGIML